ncbi:MAG: ACP S-malonyltransferase [Fimbriimonadales bacterium]|nr:ACP S-malonyltransferase [Fimbriimonadales bacterium]
MFAVVFPGQGSQKPGMGRELHDAFASARNVFDQVSEAIGSDVRAVCFEMDEHTLRQTQNAQIALYACGVAAFEAFREAGGPQPDLAAGHSIGEYAALAAAGIVSVGDGARLVAARGRVMAESGRERPGGMAAVLGLERERLEEVCREASSGGEVVVVANDNCPGQLVVSGDKAAVERACTLATQAGAKRAIPLNVSGAFHSPLMEEPARRMGEALRTVAFGPGNGTRVVGNVEADANDDPARWPELLEAQLRRPVRWTESVRRMLELGASAFVECGVGDVLTGLLRRIDRDAKGLRASDPETVAQAVAELRA